MDTTGSTTFLAAPLDENRKPPEELSETHVKDTHCNPGAPYDAKNTLPRASTTILIRCELFIYKTTTYVHPSRDCSLSHNRDYHKVIRSSSPLLVAASGGEVRIPRFPKQPFSVQVCEEDGETCPQAEECLRGCCSAAIDV